MDILVNGAGGFLGSAVVRAALAAGHRVRATDLPRADLAALAAVGAETVPGDLLDRPACRTLCEGVEAVVNVAGLFDFSLSAKALEDANVRCTVHMAEAAAAAGVRRFVHVSTIGVYGTPSVVPMPESGPKRPKNDYEKTKWAGEQAAVRFHEERALPVAVLRPAVIYGPGGRYGIAGLVAGLAALRAAGRREVRLPSGGSRIHNVHVEDVAAAALLLLEKDGAIGNAYNCGDEDPIAWGDLFAEVADALELARRPVAARRGLGGALATAARVVPEKTLARWNRGLERQWSRAVERFALEPALKIRIDRDFFGYFAGDHVYDVSRLRRLGFRWKHPRFGDGIRETIAWYRARRWIP